MSSNAKLHLCLALFVIGIANFLAFFVMAVYLGGDAVNGKVTADHFYLMSHGRYTEVSESIYRYSLWHARSVWVTHPLALIAGYWYYRVKAERTPRAAA
jgi:hypothetical protein